MTKKYLIEEDHDITVSNEREQRINSLSLRTENELFNEAAYHPLPLFNVRYICTARRGEFWEILEDKKLKLKVPAERLSRVEKDLLKSSEGMVWFLKEVKAGIKSVADLKRKIKEKLDERPARKDRR
jgi:hypothetical protein